MEIIRFWTTGIYIQMESKYEGKIILGQKMILLGTSKMKKGLFRNGSGNDRDCI